MEPENAPEAESGDRGGFVDTLTPSPRKAAPMATVQQQRHAGGRPRQVQRCELGIKIERLAAARGMHLDEVAKAADITTAGLYQILTGKIRSPRLATVKALATALGVKLEKLA